MPTTRSRSQMTLQFHCKKSGRVVLRRKNTSDLVLQSAMSPLSPSSKCTDKSASASVRFTPLPLSPRKRTGDENGCNLPLALLGPPPKFSSSKLPMLSPRKLAFDENTLVLSGMQKEVPSLKSTSTDTESLNSHTIVKSSLETLDSSCSCPEKGMPKPQIISREVSQCQNVKQALHTAAPERLLCRQKEKQSICSFLVDRVMAGIPSSLYISGAPGTGKTACLNRVLEEMENDLQSVQKIVINCMTLCSSQSIFPLLAQHLGVSGGSRHLEVLLTKSGPTILLVLDELDQLDSKAQDVLYTIFEWPYLRRSRLCLIGIANALDLTDRILPRLQARPGCRPHLLHFPPYSREELMAIVQDRLSEVSGNEVLDVTAIQFCARKVSAVSGDARKALDICRRAVEIVESGVRTCTPKMPFQTKVLRVGAPQVARVLSEVYGDRMFAGPAEGESFPLQQKLLLCCLLMLMRQGKGREIPLGKLHEAYSRICAQRQVVGVCQGECLSLCSLLESRGIFSIKKAKEARLTKVSLKVEERDVENYLKDHALLGTILSSALPPP